MKLKKSLLTIVSLVCIAGFSTGCSASTNNVQSAQQPPRNLRPEDESMFTHVFDQELDGLRITAYHGDLTQVMLPDEILGFPIVAIDRTAFNFRYVTAVFFPETVQYFGWGGSIQVESDDEPPYSWVIPFGVTHLYQVNARWGRFSVSAGANLRSLELPSSLQYIGAGAFRGFSSLTSLTIPHGVAKIQEGTFANAASLLAISFPSTIEYVSSSSGLQDTSWWATQPDGLVYVGSVAYRWKGDMPAHTSVTIQEGTTTISPNLFRRQPNLSGVTLPDSLMYIGNSAFEDTSITAIELPSTLASIGSRAFSGSNLTSVTLPAEITEIRHDTFAGTQLTQVNIPSGVSAIGSSAFRDTPLTHVTLPDTLTSIGNSAFTNTMLTEISIPDSVTNMGGSVFNDTPLTSITIGNGITRIADGMFRDLPLTSITIGNGITRIADGMFRDLPLTSVTLGSGVTQIGNNAFANTNLESITLPASLTEIGDRAFANTQLTSITLPRGIQTVSSSSFANAFENVPLEHINLGDFAGGGSADIFGAIIDVVNRSQNVMQLRQHTSSIGNNLNRIYQLFPNLTSVTVDDTEVMIGLINQLVATREPFDMFTIDGRPAIVLSTSHVNDVREQGLSFDDRLTFRRVIRGYVVEHGDGYVFLVYSVD